MFDEVFGRLKAEHKNKQQRDMLASFQMGLMSFGVGAGAGGVAFASLGASNTEAKKSEDDIPKSFDNFQELYNSKSYRN